VLQADRDTHSAPHDRQYTDRTTPCYSSAAVLPIKAMRHESAHLHIFSTQSGRLQHPVCGTQPLSPQLARPLGLHCSSCRHLQQTQATTDRHNIPVCLIAACMYMHSSDATRGHEEQSNQPMTVPTVTLCLPQAYACFELSMCATPLLIITHHAKSALGPTCPLQDLLVLLGLLQGTTTYTQPHTGILDTRRTEASTWPACHLRLRHMLLSICNMCRICLFPHPALTAQRPPPLLLAP
jgi:hypothetical protein